jgi:hypothetical protein
VGVAWNWSPAGGATVAPPPVTVQPAPEAPPAAPPEVEGVASRATVVFKNGKQVVGELVAIEGGTLRLRLPDGEETEVQRTAVREIRYGR